jgi:DNA-binding GntR family transcriptional regulator
VDRRLGLLFVALELHEAVNLYDVREVLDGLAARLAASRATPAALTELEKCLAQMKRCVDRADQNHGSRHTWPFTRASCARLSPHTTTVKMCCGYGASRLRKVGWRRVRSTSSGGRSS